MKILYCDCFSGVSGDMFLGAFLDAGIDGDYLKKELDKLHVEGFHLEIHKGKKHGISGTNCKVVLEKHEHKHRHFSDIKKIVEESELADEVKNTALLIFKKVAEAEGKVHGIAMEEVHFHEVGAIDSIVDIVGAAICFHAAAPDKIYTSAVNVGQGVVKCAHGLMPVPAPATAEISAASGIPLYSRYADGETATPTGMAILSTFAEYAEEFPLMQVDSIGYGFGEKDYTMLNGLRLFVGHSAK
ncbi:MAG: nickel pincer cofactor biosynthesis protein LarC [Lachnospiraceae bacterium]|nr:nickel pincer cofactor biosynthesis protein LarC [Lachnospiraceae bacterium]